MSERMIKQFMEMVKIDSESGNEARMIDYLFDEFKEACDRWTLHNVNLGQDLLALDYGLCGILSVYKRRLETLPDPKESVDFRLQMEEYIDNIMCSSMLFSQAELEGMPQIRRSGEYKH